MPRTIVIGGGLGGLALAALLASHGHEVTLLEKNQKLGGRANTFSDKGFTFDMGPSWYMMPEVFEKFFSLFGKKVSDYYELKRLDTHYKVMFDDHRTYNVVSDIKKNLHLFAEHEKDGDVKLHRYLEKSQYLYNEALEKLILLNYQSLRPVLSPAVLLNLLSFDLFRSFHDYTKQSFSNPDLQKILEFTTVFLGGSPYNTPAFYSLIAHADYNLGIWHPMGGIYKVVEAVVSLARENGVTIKTGESVERILVENGQAKAVHTDTSTYEADFVVCNADYQFCETQLLPPEAQTYPEKFWQNATLSPSAFLLYLGIDGKLPQLEHHNLYFGDNWEEHFSTVYKKANWPDNPSYYIHCPSRTDSSLAPKKGETVIVLVPIAAGLPDSSEIREKMTKQVITHLSNLIDEDISSRILTKRVFTLNDFSKEYNAYRGSAFGLAHTLRQTALFRPKNFSKKVKNLYYVGQYTNPGVGMPMVLLSAQIAAEMILNDKR